jgi:hypothetical protein
MSDSIETIAAGRRITRLCHFTPSRSLSHILAGKTGILPTAQLQSDARLLYNPTDLKRLDNHPGHVCCSIEYPNAWYLDRARAAEFLFPDWIIVIIKPELMWRRGTLFSERNAAAQVGRLLGPGPAKFQSLFASAVSGPYGKNRSRSPNHLHCCPTNDQAEVMVPARIELSDILGIVVENPEQAKAETMRLEICGIDVSDLPFLTAPVLFDKNALSASIRAGVRPAETIWRR